MLKKIVVAAGVLAALSSNAAFGAGASTVQVNGGNMNVNATVNASCQVAITTAVNFGAISIIPGAQATPGTFTVTCDSGTDYAVGIGSGFNHTSTRNMSLNGAGATLLPYELYVDSSYSAGAVFNNVTLGNNVGNTPATGTVGGQGSGNSVPYSVYGMIPASASKPVPGTYSDSVAVTLIY